VVVDGWCSRQDARAEIERARERFRGLGETRARPAIGGRIPADPQNR
jgi:hypothetical protein